MAAAALALTCGDPSGIGPEITIDAWLQRDARAVPAFYLIGDASLVEARAAQTGKPVPVARIDPEQAPSVFADALPVTPLRSGFRDSPGKPSPVNAPGILESIERAVANVRSGVAAALVTNPISKKPLYEAGFGHPGHTEFLGELARNVWGIEARPVMMIAGPDLRTVPVTIHIPLADVPMRLSTDLIAETGRIVAHDLARYFSIARPRLAFAGLNPHAGENGAMGNEDLKIVAPAVALLRGDGIDAVGPLPADTMFHPRARALYDVAICMYHDQALIPAKTLGFDEAVNVTLGLPFVRTSPDHGTAFDIAGKGIARPDSLVAALRMARAMADAAGAAE